MGPANHATMTPSFLYTFFLLMAHPMLSTWAFTFVYNKPFQFNRVHTAAVRVPQHLLELHLPREIRFSHTTAL